MRTWMKRGVSLLAALALLAGGCTTGGAPERPPGMDRDGNKIFDDLDDLLRRVGDNETIPVLMMMKDQAEALAVATDDEFDVKHRYTVVPAVAASMTKAQIVKQAGSSAVKHIEYDAEVKVLMGTASQWFGATKARQDFGVTGDRDGNPTGYTEQDVVVAVIDTGIDAGHIDLDGGKVIAWRDWVQNRATAYDDHGHGTHVAGIIAGAGDGSSLYTGVAPGAALIGLKVLDANGSGTLSNVTAAVDWAVANRETYNIKVISLSLGTSGSSDGNDTLSQAVNSAADQGIIPVIAAGNSGPGRYTVGSPGAAVKAITVGAMADVGEGGFGMASFSSRGPTQDDRMKPEISAPGYQITAPKANSGNAYVTYSGTSMATPFVSGTIALMLDANPDLTIQQVKSLLQQTAQDWGTAGQDIDYGWGRLDSYRAVARAGDQPEDGAPAVPGHQSFTGTLSSGSVVEHTFQVTNTSYPINVTLLMPGTGSNPDHDLYLYNPAGQEIAKSTSLKRQEQVTVNGSQPGIYRARVKAYSGSGDYVLDISAGISADPPPPDEPPTVSITQPAEGATVSGVVEVSIQAADDQSIDRVEVAVDDGSYQLATPDGSAYRYSWHTDTVSNGAHVLHARAFDTAGQQAQQDRTVTVLNEGGPEPGDQLWTRTGQVSPSARNLEFDLNVGQVGYVDFTLGWGTTADLDLFVYAPNGSLAGRAYTLANPERLRIDTVRYGSGTYRVRVNLYSGPTTSFTLTAAGYQRMTYTGTVSAANRNSTHPQIVEYTGQSRIVLSWPGSADLDFFVYDPSGQERARAYTLNNPEIRDFPMAVTGQWSVRVNLYSGATTSYTLHWFIPSAVLS